MKTVKEHLENLYDQSTKEWCLKNMDESKAHEMCETPAMAIMIGVNRPESEKDKWDDACRVAYKEFENSLKQ